MVRFLPLLSILFSLCSLSLPAQPQYWTARGMGGGGAFFGPALGSGGLLYLHSDMSAYYRSSDFGAAWTTLPFTQLQASGSTTGIQLTSSPTTMYAISVAGGSNRPMRTTDGGVNWVPLPSDPSNGSAISLLAFPGTTALLALANSTTLWFSGNGGQTFSQVATTSGGTGLHLAGVAWDASTVTIATNIGLYISANAGATFLFTPTTGIPSDEALVSFAAARQGTTVRAYGITGLKSNVGAGLTGASHGIFRKIYTMNSSGTWTSSITGLGVGAHPMFIRTSAANPDIAWCAGGSAAGTPIVYRTTNAGASWQNVFLSTGNQNIATGWSGAQGDRDWTYGEYALGLAMAADNPDRAVITDLGFVHVTANGGQSWRQAYLNGAHQNPAGAPTPKGRFYGTNGLENTSCWQVAFLDQGRVYGCYTDIRGAYSEDQGATWTQNFTGHTQNTMYRIARDPFNEFIYAATSTVHDLYQSTTLTDAAIDGGQGKVLWSQDFGKTWELLHDFQHPVFWVASDPSTQGRLYASVVHSTQGGIYRTTTAQNGSSSVWTKVTNPPRTEGHPHTIVVLKDGAVVCTYSGRRVNNQFTASSGVFLSTDFGNTWQDRSAPNMQYWTKDVVIDPGDPNQSTWYVGVWSGWGGPPNDKGGLYRSIDRGQTWTRLLQNSGVTSITLTEAGGAYVTTESSGLLYSADIRAASPTFTPVAGFPFRQPERVFFNPDNPSEVWVATFGHGILLGTPAPLPVELASFSASRRGAEVVLRWTTAMERSNAGFEIQRSADRREWTTLDLLPGSGDSDEEKRWTWTDRTATASQAHWYRLVQRDMDGSRHFSAPLYVDAGSLLAIEASLSPMPVNDGGTLSLALAGADHIRIFVVDLLGRRLLSREMDLEGGVHRISLATASLRPGRYHCVIEGSRGSRTLPLVVSR